MIRRCAGALVLALLSSAAAAQGVPPEIIAAMESEAAASRNAVSAARSGMHGNALLAERQALSARERGNATLAAIVVDGVARYPAQANEIVAAAVARAPEARDSVVTAVQRAYPTLTVQTVSAVPERRAESGRSSLSRERRSAPAAASPALPPDVMAALQRATRPAPDGAKAVAGATGNQPLAQQFAGHDQRQVTAAVSAAVVTAIAQYPDRTREIVSTAVALAPQARDAVVMQASASYPAFAEAILTGAGSPSVLGPEPETRRSKRREQIGPEEMWDPIETVNRGVFAVNDVFDQYLLRPVAWVYSYAPDPMKRSVRNFFTNLASPALFGNDLLQAELTDAAVTVGRFLINTTVGVGGLFDPATSFGLEAHHADFGQTMHVYGVGPGPYLVLPIFGPSTLRDGVGLVGDTAMRPETWLAPQVATLASGAAQGIVLRESLLKPLDDLRANSLDYYAALRSAYYQTRVARLNRKVTAFQGGAAAPSGPTPSSTETDKLFDEAK
jgi:phospholipid-binding lipoprotein MlaA